MQPKIIFDKNTNDGGTHFCAYLNHPYSFEEAVARIYALCDYNIFEEGDEDKLSFQASGIFNNEVFTLYDWKENCTVHIGGRANLDAQSLEKYLLKIAAKHANIYNSQFKSHLQIIRKLSIFKKHCCDL